MMRQGALFLCRVNSLKDVNFGSRAGVAIERNYFDRNGIKKRYFDEEMVMRFFSGIFAIEAMEETSSRKYGVEKRLWEIALRKSDTDR